MFGASHQGEGIEDVWEIVKEQPSGRNDLDEIQAEPFLSERTSRTSRTLGSDVVSNMCGPYT